MVSMSSTFVLSDSKRKLLDLSAPEFHIIFQQECIDETTIQ